MDISHIKEVVTREGYPIMQEAYDEQPKLYPEYCEVHQGTDAILLGDKGSVLTGLGDLQRRENGADIEYDELRTALTWYMATQHFARAIKFTETDLKAANAAGRVANLITTAMGSWGENAALQKDDWAADFFQQGTLTAGNSVYFDGSFTGQTDPNPTVGYDALPFFDTAHTQKIGGNTFANHVVSSTLTHANLTAAGQVMTATNSFDDRNRRVRIRPDLLMVPTGLEDEARVILESTKLSGSAQNDANTNQNKYRLLVNPFLDDAASASSWWLGQARKGVRFYDWGEPVARVWFEESTRSVHVSVETHWGMVLTNWRYWSCRNKAAS